MILRMLLLLTPIMLSSCGAIGALSRAATPLDAYELRGNIPAVRKPSQGRLHLIVEVPVTAASLDTDRILIRPNRLQTQYLPDGRWTDPPSKMLQTALVRELDGTGAFAYVGRTPLGAGGDYALLSEITAFEGQVDPEGRPLVHLRLSARLIHETDLAVASRRTFDVALPVATTATVDLVRGMDAALSQMTDQIVRWAVTAL